MKNKKWNTDYKYYEDLWKEYLISKGFELRDNSGGVLTFVGCHPEVRIQVYAGEFRTDTDTKGCICGDFDKTWNKVSQCPIYFDLEVSKADLWKSIEMLINAGPEFSEECGRIEYQAGQLNYNPPLYNKKEKQECHK